MIKPANVFAFGGVICSVAGDWLAQPELSNLGHVLLGMAIVLYMSVLCLKLLRLEE